MNTISHLHDVGVVVLVGLMGSGKSTVGTRLAQRLHCSFIDIDAQILREQKMTVSEIFAQSGEKVFREIEASVLAQVLDDACAQIVRNETQSVVVATGGGAVLRVTNRNKILNAATHVIWLDADVDTLVTRTSLSKNVRPLLETDPRSALTTLSNDRSDLYEQIATERIVTSNLGVDQVVDAVMQVVQSSVSK
ncbi:MAG: shikimate kinase [Actinobacteria bacterium]|nr:MAG: shikimate kinase [Actinomycetota bacterium]